MASNTRLTRTPLSKLPTILGRQQLLNFYAAVGIDLISAIGVPVKNDKNSA
jgi:hypothetical protein